ncbi:Ca(2+)-dependent cysteine protease MCA1 [Sugiyamaella lignohabitans]|uniref:Metacaspase-1 n=1 Tax=Sugiyamaella lignohabitans TaxID=796027 RepID=A0A167F838_9ASCO|nr:Ca(2+)-dependent cysteine protease MCA1 [Sugiyamaella lignohabitans]ANB14936.1 Ca(2+)-dependent cysteine protease MCA1 [Sugiyamaella lignohabitans]
MSYPGQQHNSYGHHGSSGGGGGGYGPPSGPPPQQGGYGGGYDSSGYGSSGDYGPPSGPPPTGPRPDFGGSHSNGGSQYSSYGPPSGPPPGSHPGEYGHSVPTNQMHSYGPNDQLQYQLSDCSGKRKALCIGINYIGSKNALRGCINDAHAISAYLQDRHGYKKDDMVILTDDSRDPRSIPTKENILRAMQWLVSGAQTNDTLFLHYSGHGGQTRDLDGDEDDGFDETIYPVDFEQAGNIVDDQIHDIVVRPLMPGVRLTALFDSCHSGSILDLPYLYSTKGLLKEPNLAKDAGMGLMGAVTSYSRGDLMGVFNSLNSVYKKATTGGRANEITRRTKFSPADVIQLSGCKDDQTSADAVEGGTNTGAMSYSFIEVMSQNPNQSYISLLNNMRQVMARKYTQRPQLSCSHPLDMNLHFMI